MSLRMQTRHRLRRPVLVVGLWLLCIETICAAPAIAIIANPSGIIPGLTERDIAKVFRRKLQLTPAGEPLVPVNLALRDPLRTVFSRRVFGLPPDAFETYWTERYFHGVSPPHVVESSEAMLRFVQATPGAIGYVWSCDVDRRVEVVLELLLEGRAAVDWFRHCGSRHSP